MINLQKIAHFAQTIHGQNQDGHDFEHITRVVALAQKILLTEPNADHDLVLATCYLHDSYDEKLFPDSKIQKAKVCTFLTENAFDETVKNEIFEIIDKMSFSANLTEKQTLSLNGQIVQDADRLDAMGAWGIVRTLEYGWAHRRPLYIPFDQPVKSANKTSYHAPHGSTLTHFYEKLFLLKDLLNTSEAKKIGQNRDQILHQFVQHIEQEYEESHDN